MAKELQRLPINVMIDLETLGLKPGCAVIAIGATVFYTPTVKRIIDWAFFANISQTSNESAGLKADPATLAWRAKQSAEAKEGSLYGNADLKEALADFSAWISCIEGDTHEAVVWGNAASFDLKSLEAAYEACNLPVPWRYYNEMCFRTLKNLTDVPEPEFKGVKHNALADAMHQARWAEEILHAIEDRSSFS